MICLIKYTLIFICICSFQQSTCQIQFARRESEEHVACHDEPCLWLPGRSAAARRSPDCRPRSHACWFCFYFYILTQSKHCVLFLRSRGSFCTFWHEPVGPHAHQLVASISRCSNARLQRFTQNYSYLKGEGAVMPWWNCIRRF